MIVTVDFFIQCECISEATRSVTMLQDSHKENKSLWRIETADEMNQRELIKEKNSVDWFYNPQLLQHRRHPSSSSFHPLSVSLADVCCFAPRSVLLLFLSENHFSLYQLLSLLSVRGERLTHEG